MTEAMGLYSKKTKYRAKQLAAGWSVRQAKSVPIPLLYFWQTTLLLCRIICCDATYGDVAQIFGLRRG
jgi:hypothetical protein